MLSVCCLNLPPAGDEQRAPSCAQLWSGTGRGGLEFKKRARGQLFALAQGWDSSFCALFWFLPLLKVVRLILAYSMLNLYCCYMTDSCFIKVREL